MSAPTPKRDALTMDIARARRNHQMVLDALATDPEAERRKKARDLANQELLPADSPYRRLCFICGLRGHCGHREILVEAAYAEVAARRRLE